MLQALGVRLSDAAGDDIPPGGAAKAVLDRIDARGADPRLSGVGFVVATDVTNPLVGPAGFGGRFGPQKGVSPADVELLDAALTRFAEVLEHDLGVSVAGFTAAHALTEVEPDTALPAEPRRLLAELAARVVPALLRNS